MARFRPTVFAASVSAVAAAAAALFWQRAQQGANPRYLLELPAEAVTATRTRPVGVAGDGAGLSPGGEPDPNGVAEDALARARAEGRREAQRQMIRGLAGAVSLMAIGAMVAILVLWATGAFDARVVTFLPEQSTPAVAAEVEGTDVAPAPAPTATPTPAAASLVGQRPDPATITIPSIGVEASVIPLATRGGVLEVPEDFDDTGWWTEGPEPGEVGPAVIVGHVDSFDGPAVFFDLEELKFGDLVEVLRDDGSTAVFSVTSSFQVDKDEFPTQAVYGETESPELRLITCHGDFRDGSYLGNYIVMAELVEEVPPETRGVLY